MTVINLSDYRGGAAGGSLRAVAFWIAANGAEHLIRFDLFADRAQLIAWLTPLAPPDHVPAEGLRAACLSDGREGKPAVWITLCREHLRASTIAHVGVQAMQILGVETDGQPTFLEDLLSCCLGWLADDGETLDAEGE